MRVVWRENRALYVEQTQFSGSNNFVRVDFLGEVCTVHDSFAENKLIDIPPVVMHKAMNVIQEYLKKHNE